MATINGTAGNDTLNGTNQADVINGFAGDDTIEGGGGNDDVFAGAGNDYWLAGDRNSGNDQVFLGDGDDTAEIGFFFRGGREEILDGGSGIDTLSLNGAAVSGLALNAALDNSGTATGSFTSTAVNFENLEGNGANNVLTGNDSTNVIEGLGGNDTLDGQGGDDTLDGGDGNDSIQGGAGDDVIIAGDGQDNVDGGTGNDTIFGGGDNDNLNGGADADTIIINDLGGLGSSNSTVNGGNSGDDNDTLDVSELLAQGFVVQNFTQNPENNGNPGFNGQIQLSNPTTGQSVNINYSDIENIIICFTTGSMIATPQGERAVETLRAGDKVFTRDNGIQEIRWIGNRRLGKKKLAESPQFQPVLVRKGSIAHNIPERDLLVSPNHRLLLSNKDTNLMFEEPEVLVAAKFLTDRDGIEEVQADSVTYFHILFDQHEVVLSDGAWTESFQPGEFSMNGLPDAQRAEIIALFPELETQEGLNNFESARHSIKAHEARLLVG